MFGLRVVWEEAAEIPGLDGAATALVLCLGWVQDVSEARYIGKVILVFTPGVQLKSETGAGAACPASPDNVLMMYAPSRVVNGKQIPSCVEDFLPLVPEKVSVSFFRLYSTTTKGVGTLQQHLTTLGCTGVLSSTATNVAATSPSAVAF